MVLKRNLKPVKNWLLTFKKTEKGWFPFSCFIGLHEVQALVLHAGAGESLHGCPFPSKSVMDQSVAKSNFQLTKGCELVGIWVNASNAAGMEGVI